MTKNQRRYFEKARRSSSGWTARELRRAYRAFRFQVTEGGNHTIYMHPDLDELAAVTRSSGDISAAYVDDFVTLIERLTEE